MKIWVTGGSGLLGRAVVKELKAQGHEVVAPSHAQCDVSSAGAVYTAFDGIRPDAIVNCAAQRKPDLCQSRDKDVLMLNCDCPRQLAAFGVPLIHISTDYVFAGNQAPYEVDAQRRPLNAYGEQKAAAEAAIEAYDNVAILRVPILFGPTKDLRESAVTVLAANLLAAKGASVKMDDVAIRYPTYTPDVAKQIAVLLDHAPKAHGIWHYSGDIPMTKYLMALTMAPLIGCQGEQCIPDTTPCVVPRPYDCHLSVKKLQQCGWFVPPTPVATALLLTL